MVKFRQLIRPGNKGRDVTVVKPTLRRMNIPGSGAMGTTNFAGEAFVKCIKRVQRMHGLKVDGIYGESTHKIIAPHFTDSEAKLYANAKIRIIPEPPVTDLSAQQAAKKLIASKKYHADNSGDLVDLKRTAAGKPVWSPLGYWVHLDKRPLEALLYLINKGYAIGTFALCSDHHSIDGPSGHNGGHAVDISSINGVGVVAHSTAARANTLRVAKLLNSKMPHGLTPRQLICGGYGNNYDSAISSQTIPNTGFYGYETMREHRNHIHVGY